MEKQTWKGREVYEITGKFDQVREQLPEFDKMDFTSEAGELPSETNKYYDAIVNRNNNMPIATVSKNYGLIQHGDTLDIARDTLGFLGYRTADSEWTVKLTEFDERMWATVQLPMSFDPGDGHVMQVQMHIRNSVDRSIALSMSLGWYRLICKNGLMSMVRSGRVSRRHTSLLTPEHMSKRLENSVDQLMGERDVYKKWNIQKISVGQGVLEDWIDKTVNPKWGAHISARTYHIIRTAHDGKVSYKDSKDKVRRGFPHRISVESESKVPGSKPTETLLDVAHAMSYISSHQRSIQARIDMMHDVPEMMHELARRTEQ